jgi:dolichyl-phosphate beta-glucosyltransferase
MDLSIVIPAYNEQDKVAHDVEAAADFLLHEGMNGEILVVDDGSDDGTAEAAREARVLRGVDRHVIRYTPNRGKGHAVKTGMVQTRGAIAMFADVGLCVPFENAMRGIEPIRHGQCELAHGSRKLPESVLVRKQHAYRRALSWMFRKAAGFIMGIPGKLSDTQCGFKIYRGDVARELYAACRTDGFMFDIEILLRALRKGYRVVEFPVEWRCDFDSRLRPAHEGTEVFKELRRIKRELKEEGETQNAEG